MTVIYTQVMSKIEDQLYREGWQEEVINKYRDYFLKKSVQALTGRTTSTDANRTKTYRAEWAFQSKVKSKTFETSADARRYMKKVLASKTWEKIGQGRKAQLVVRKMGSKTAGRAQYGQIELCADKGMDEYTLLHELAHVAGNMHHDVSFRTTLLKLVSRFMGVEPAKILKQCFKDQKLKMNVSTTIKAPSEWLVAYEKMSKIREMKQCK